MFIVSIDVGIKNLAICCFEKKEKDEFYHIKKWDIVNIGEKETYLCQEKEKEKEKTSKKKSKSKSKIGFSNSNGVANGVANNEPLSSNLSSNLNNNNNLNVETEFLCGKPAQFMKNNHCFCLKHAKKSSYLLPNNELKLSFINKQKVQKLFEMADQYQIPYDTKTKKVDLISLLTDYIENTCLVPIHSTNASKIDIITIGKNIQFKLDEMFYSSQEPFVIDYVIIENQISPIANRMKTIQGMISQYFIMKGNVKNIEFISASNKLKDLNAKEGEKKETYKKKMDYKDRKKAGIQKCLELLNENPLFQKEKEHFEKHKKKDDLADCFLQGYWFLHR